VNTTIAPIDPTTTKIGRRKGNVDANANPGESASDTPRTTDIALPYPRKNRPVVNDRRIVTPKRDGADSEFIERPMPGVD